MKGVLKKIQEKYKKEYGKLGISLVLSEDAGYPEGDIGFVVKKKYFQLFVVNEKDILRIKLNAKKIQSSINGLVFAQIRRENFLKITDAMYKEIARELGCHGIILEEGYGLWAGNEGFHRFGYRGIENIPHYNIMFDYSFMENSMYLNITKSFLEKKAKAIYGFMEMMEEIYGIGTDAAFQNDYYYGRHYFNVYHRGAEVTLHLIYKNNDFCLSYEKKEKCENIGLNEEEIKNFFDKLEKNHRIKNISSPPRYHFNKYLNGKNVQRKVADTIYEKLCSEHMPGAIEEYFTADARMEPVYSIGEIKLYKFMGKYFVADNEEAHMHYQNEKHKIKESIKKLSFKACERKLEKEMENKLPKELV